MCVLVRSPQIECHSGRSQPKIASGDLSSSIPFLNVPNASDKAVPFLGESTLCHLEAAKDLFSTLKCQQYHLYHGYLLCGRKEEQRIARSKGKHFSTFLHCLAGPRFSETSGMLDPRFSIDVDRVINAYAKDKHRGHEADDGRRDT